MSSETRFFLIVFDRNRGSSEVVDLGSDVRTAMPVYDRRERELSGRPDVEVVLVGSESLETLKRTHSSYFGASDAIAGMLSRAGTSG